MLLDPPAEGVPQADELLRAAMEWHFSPETGSPYWVGRAKEFDFDPRADVAAVADLRLFANVGVDFSAVPAGQLIPRGCLERGDEFGVYESGGATGAPKRIVDATSRAGAVRWQSRMLDEQGFPAGEGSWLHIGPTGPHIMAKNVRNLAHQRGFLCNYVDLDPRWVRRCLAEGRREDFQRYVDHIFDQVRDVVASQPVRAISSTPRMLELLTARTDVLPLLRQTVRGVIWGGTSADGETLRLLQEEVFPEATVRGVYGNTMMGIAPQRSPLPDDKAGCVFRPFHPYSIVELVDPENPDRAVDVDEEGRVRVTVLSRDFFAPPTLERDLAIRRASAPGWAGLELSQVRPYEPAGTKVIEGVY
jgi:hypothetical protein